MSARTRKTPVVWLGLAGVVVLAAVLALVMGGGETQTAPVEVDGADLPRLEGAADPAIGAAAPALRGTGLDGEPLEVEPGGEPMMLLFLAHWCPVCRDEVPRVQSWIAEGGKPGGVALVAVATGNDRNRPNHPPGEWLDGEGWSPRTLLDGEGDPAARAYGLSGFPFWVLVDGDGRVAGRHAGALPVEALEAVMTQLAAGGG